MVGKKIVIDGETLYSPDFYYDGESFGTFFKDIVAFDNKRDEVCYIPEAHFADEEPAAIIDGRKYYRVDGYTRNDLEELVRDEVDEDNEPIDVDYFFQSLLWCCPETRLSEITY